MHGSLSGWAGWAVLGAVLLVTAALVILAFRSTGRERFRYDGPPDRDLRIDMLRGLAIVFVVVNNLGLVSLFQTGTQEAIGVVSGAELFVLLSGVVLGMVYRPKVVSGGIGEVVIRATGRAWQLYTTALVVILLVFVLSLVPFIDADAVTTFGGGGTEGEVAAASGQVSDLYAGAEGLLDYPVPPWVITDFALLRFGPWQFNVMGLYVVLLLIAPVVLWALSRRWWAAVIAVSGALYAVGTVARTRILPSQFEDAFPLLVWQVLFVVGLVAGYHRREIVGWFHTRSGQVTLCVLILLAVGFAAFSWNNPHLSSSLDARIALMPDDLYRSIYAAFFGRTYLEIGRLLNVFLVVVALYALLTAYWRPLHRAIGWFLVPLGQATLYVFIVHVFFALVVANIPALRQGDLVINSLGYVVVLGSIWVLVKKKVLFQVVPR